MVPMRWPDLKIISAGQKEVVGKLTRDCPKCFHPLPGRAVHPSFEKCLITGCGTWYRNTAHSRLAQAQGYPSAILWFPNHPVHRFPVSLIPAAILAALTVAQPATAQTARIRDVNINSWWVVSGDYAVHGKWGVFTDVQARRSNFAAIWQQFQTHNLVTYRLTPNVQLGGGYAYTRNGRYGDFPATRPTNEHRTFLQLTVKENYKKFELEHRYRVEQRFIQNFTTGNDYFWRYQNRLRYQLKGTLPLSNKSEERRYLSVGGELLLAYGPNHGPSPFDQDRLFAGFGYKLSTHNKLEVNYLNQFLLQRNGKIEESNHTLRVTFSTSGRLFGHK